MFSIITCTMRADPLFGCMADSLVREIKRYPMAPKVEWIIIDGWERDREQYRPVLREEFNTRLCKPKPTVWQGPYGLTSYDYPALNNARNTGLSIARGDYIIFLDDCSEVMPGWLGQYLWARFEDRPLCGIYASHRDGKPTDHDARLDYFVGEMPINWFYGMNCGAPFQMLLDIDGFDEIYDGQPGGDDVDAGIRLAHLGAKLTFSPACWTKHHLDTHVRTNWLRRGRKEKCIGEHWANESKLQEILACDRILPEGNEYRLSDLRALRKNKQPFPIATKPTTDWRDGQPLKDM